MSPDSLETRPHADRLNRLRGRMAAEGLTGFLIPKADEHQGEYIAPCSERLAWLTGFTGSAGTACVLADRAAIFVDGRYTLQAADEIDAQAFAIRHTSKAPLVEWLTENLKTGDVLGVDPWLVTKTQQTRLETVCERTGAVLKLVDGNPIDDIWTGRPGKPMNPVTPLPREVVAESGGDKRNRVSKDLSLAGLDAYVLTQPDSIAWILNVRGGDVPFTPLPLSFAVLHDDGSIDWIVERGKLAPETVAAVLGDAVRQVAPENFGDVLEALGGKAKRVGIGHALAPVAIHDRLTQSGALVRDVEDPCAKPKACKSDRELSGVIAAHVRDGAALGNFLCWLDDTASRGSVTETQAAERLEKFRETNDRFRGLSFPTISGAGPNGAIVHYRVAPETNRALEPGSLYLIDSGAQYLDGTTDVTRTIAIGDPTEEMRRVFTLVLKGHVAIADAIFPEGTTGSQLDVLAREHLWRAGLDYDHGTGHGVGTYLSVHEGPQRISKLGNGVALEPGMVISNEPGCYKPGAFGIRIENLVAVAKAETPEGGDRPLMRFETLTLAPLDRRLIDAALLDDGELTWVNAYHERVFKTLSQRVLAETRPWLEAVTRPIERNAFTPCGKHSPTPAINPS